MSGDCGLVWPAWSPPAEPNPPPPRASTCLPATRPQSRLPRLDVPLRRPPRLEYCIPGVPDQQLWWQKKKIKIMLEVCDVVQTTNKHQSKTNLDPPPARGLMFLSVVVLDWNIVFQEFQINNYGGKKKSKSC